MQGARQFGVNAQPFQGGPPIAVYGLQVANPRLATLTRRVLMVAGLSALLVVVSTVIQRSMAPTTSASSAFVSLVLALLVPCCGYFGARNSDKNLTCCFCGCNCLGSTLGIVSVLTVYLGYHFVEGVVNNCDPSVPPTSDFDCPDSKRWDILCQFYGFGDQAAEDPNERDLCYRKIQDNLPDLKTALIFQLCLAIPTIVLQCLGFCWGNKLYRELQEGHVIHSAPQYTTNQVHVQPQYSS